MAKTTFDDVRDALADAPEATVAFTLPTGPIPSGFHLTEFKRVQADSVDCGGARHQWHEAVIELLGDRHGAPISASKLLDIATRIESHLPGFAALPLYLEYAPLEGTVQRLAVSGLLRQQNRWIFTLAETKGECKANTRALETGTTTCCGTPQDARGGCCGSPPSQACC